MPKKQPKKKAPDSVRLPEDLKAFLVKKAEADNRSFSNLVITILMEWRTKNK